MNTQHNSTVFERHLTAAELASFWKVNESTIRRIFLPEPGVIVIQHPRRRTRTYKTLRIPESVAQRVYERLSIGGRRGSL